MAAVKSNKGLKKANRKRTIKTVLTGAGGTILGLAGYAGARRLSARIPGKAGDVTRKVIG